MLNANPYQQYQQNAVKSASPGEMTLSLYNGAVKFLKRSIMAVDEQDIQAANNSIIRTQDILSYLGDTLNTNYQLSESLMNLYDFMNRRLTEANIQKNRAILEEVLGLLEELRDAWGQAVKQTGGKK